MSVKIIRLISNFQIFLPNCQCFVLIGTIRNLKILTGISNSKLNFKSQMKHNQQALRSHMFEISIYVFDNVKTFGISFNSLFRIRIHCFVKPIRILKILHLKR